MFRTVTNIALIATVVLLVVHYVVFGLRRVRPGRAPEVVRRYGVVERLVHAGCLVTFFVAAATAFWPILVQQTHPVGWVKLIHAGSGAALAAFIAAAALLWALDATFIHADWHWIKVVGGHLSREIHPPAERFDAGQKIFFWTTVIFGLGTLLSGILRISYDWPDAVQQMALTAHRYLALLFVLSVMVHMYFTTLAKPGALGGMITGRVRRAWAKHHHSLWYKRVE